MEQRKTAKRVAFCGVITGFGVLVMLTGGLIPVLTYCSPLFAAALLIPVLFEYGRTPAMLVWLATSLVSLSVGADKEAAFFYVFTGWYPVVKPYLDNIKVKPLRVATKFAVFGLCIGTMYSLLLLVLRPAAVMADFDGLSGWMTFGFCTALVLIMLIYDTAILRFAVVYLRRLRPKIRKMV